MVERYRLPARLDTSGAGALVQALLSHRGQKLELDASGVEVLGARAVEVIIAAGRQWVADDVSIAVVAMSERYRTTCALLGVAAETPWTGHAVEAQGSAA